MDAQTVIGSLGEPLFVVQERSSADLIPDPFMDDDAIFLEGPLLAIYLGTDLPFEFPPAGMLASRLIAGRLLNLDVNPHLTPLSAGEIIPIWDDISARLEASGGFWLPGELNRFMGLLPQISKGMQEGFNEPPWGLYGLIGSDSISFTVRPNGYPSVLSKPFSDWTFRVEVSVSNRRVSREAYEYAKKIRSGLGNSPFKSILMSSYPRFNL